VFSEKKNVLLAKKCHPSLAHEMLDLADRPFFSYVLKIHIFTIARTPTSKGRPGQTPCASALCAQSVGHGLGCGLYNTEQVHTTM
jgi:hypothetical protein